MANSEALLTVHDVAARYGVGIKTVYNWVEWRKVPHVKIGRLVRFNRVELEKWESEQAVGARAS